MAILILLSGLFCHCSKAGIVETILFAMAILGSYLIFNMFLDFLGYGFGTAAIMTISTWYFLIRTAVYLILSLEYILISRYFVKVFREKAMVSLTNGQTVVFLVIPFLILLLLLAVPINGEDETLWACNKWLLAHADSSEAAQGAPVRLDGINVDIAADL